MQNQDQKQIQKQIRNQAKFAQRQPKKFDLSRVVLLLAIVTSVLALVGMLWVVKREGGRSGEVNPDRYFASCQPLVKNCLDVTQCQLNVYCGDETNQEDCGVYDCGKDYGVYVKLQGRSDYIYRNEPKPDTSVVEKRKAACAGTMEILSNKCVNGSREVKYRLQTQGECEILSTDFRYAEAGQKSTAMRKETDGTYTAIAGTCTEVEKVVPVTEGGLALEF